MKLVKVISLVLCLALVGCLCGCGSDGSLGAELGDKDAVHVYVRGEAENLDGMLQAFSEKIPDISLVVQGIPEDEYEETIASLQAQGIPVDIVVTPVDEAFYKAARNGAYVNLTAAMGTALHNAENTLGADFIRANKIDGALYGIPTAEYRTKVNGVVYRQDLLFNYSLEWGEITNGERLQEYLMRAATAYVTPLLLGKDGFSTINWNEKTLAGNHIFPLPGYAYTDLPAAVILSDDNTKVQGVVFAGDAASMFHGASAAYRSDFLSAALLRNAALTKYTGGSAMLDARYAQSGFLNDGAAAWVTPLTDDISQWETGTALRTQSAELGYYAGDATYYSALQQTNTPIVTDMRADYMLCIPAESTHVQEAMQVLNAMYADTESLETWMYGTRGMDWSATTTNTYTRMHSDAPYTMPTRQFAQPTSKRIPNEMNFYVYPLMANLSNANNYVLSPLAGCTLRFDDNDASWAYIRTLYRNAMQPLNFGSLGDETQNTINAIHEKAVEGGLETVSAEIATQVQAFLDANATAE